MAYETLIVAQDGPVTTITINRPAALNALTSLVLRELQTALWQLHAPKDTRCLIITGAGEKAFVAGADIAEMKDMTASEARKFSRLGHSVFAHLEDLDCPTIAAVGGYALGGGCELAISCDLVYASDNARFGQPEVNLGVAPGFGGTQRLTRLVGKQRAKEILFTGDLIPAEKAKTIGLCLEIFPRAELLANVKAIAAKIAAKGPLAVAEAKHLVEHGYDEPLSSANAREAASFGLLFDTADQKEGMKAFVEKRPPKFEGR